MPLSSRNLCIAIFGLLSLAAPLPAFAQSAAPTPSRIVIAGDSTVSNYNTEKTKSRGWGMYIQEQFKPGSVEVTNLAYPGRSTKTFLKEGRWAKGLEAKPNYILMQFGHNDSHDPQNREATDFAADFKDYLRQFIEEARAINATPILITPMVRREFDAQGKIIDAPAPSRPLSAYATSMKEVATEKHVAVIDLYSSSKALTEKLGPKESVTLANSSSDITHFGEKGARAMAALIVEALPAADPNLASLLKPRTP